MMPQQFSGSYENAVAWLQDFELWLNAQRNLNERARISHFALQMKDSARSWVSQFQIVDPPVNAAEVIPQNHIYAFADLRQRFLDRFRRPEDARSQDIASLYDFKQSPTQTTESFVNEMMKRGEAAGATEEHVRYAVLHGLQDNIKTVVLHHENADLQEIIKWGVTAERITKNSAPELTMAVEKLERMMDKLKVSSVSVNG